MDTSRLDAHRIGVTGAALDRLLAVLIVALATTGVVSLNMGAPGDGWLFALHGILAGALAVTAAVKVVRSLPRALRGRHWGRAALGLFVSIATAAALVGGFAWVASGRLLSIGSWTVLTIHAWIGLALVPVVVIHLLPRRWRLLLPSSTVASTRRLSRRHVLAGTALVLASASIYGLTALADRLAGGVRRVTGSRWLPAGGVPPPTTFYGEPPPAIETAAWRLRVAGRVARSLELSVGELRALGERDLVAILDCTSGWAVETTWHGVPLAAVLESAGASRGARSIVVRSATGFATVLRRSDADRCLLATDVVGQPLPAANGAPCRLVVPDHRGLDWIKWVTEIEVV